jgi:rRNA maturation endonuclease Nob1
LAAAEVGHETTKRVLIGNIDDFGAISQCEKCYKMLDVFMKFCPNCGRKIEGDKA